MNFRNPPHKRKPFFPLLVIVVALVAGALVMLLWNYIFPDLLGIKKITYWQSVALFALCKLLFGFGGRPPFSKQHHWKERLQNLSEEEKEKWRDEWRSRFKKQ